MPPGGNIISDRYELGDRLGSGGMSTVYGATDRVLERTVAVKILAEHLSDDEKFVARFRREALAVARLIHPNIVQVYDTGRRPRTATTSSWSTSRAARSRSSSSAAAGSAPRSPSRSACSPAPASSTRTARASSTATSSPGNLMVIGGPGGPARIDGGSARPADRRDDREADGLRHRPGGRADAPHPGRLGRRHRRLPRARAGPRRTKRPRPPTSTRSASSSTRCSRLACPGRARALPSWRSAASPRAPSRPPRTTPRCPRRSRPPCSARSKARSHDRYSTAKEFSAALRAGIAGREPPVASDEAPTRALIAGGAATAATRAMDSPGHRDAHLARTRLPARRAAPLPLPRPRPVQAAEAIRRLPLPAGAGRAVPGRDPRRGDRHRRPRSHRRRPEHGPRRRHLGRDQSADRQAQGARRATTLAVALRRPRARRRPGRPARYSAKRPAAIASRAPRTRRSR